MNIFSIAPLSAWRTLYKIAKSSIDNGTAPTQMRAILRCDLLTWQLRRRYAHRNGETTTPTEPGLYWFHGQARDIATEGMIWIVATDDGLRWYPLSDSLKIGMDGLAHFAGQWWGPVAPPWEQST